MHVFGSVCYAYVQDAKKLEPRSKEGLFVAYDKRSPAYLVYYPQSMKVERVRCVKFFDSSSTHSQVPLSEEEIAPRPIVTTDVSQICMRERVQQGIQLGLEISQHTWKNMLLTVS